MSNIEVKKRIAKLREEISRLRFAYHVENDPRVTDDVYESLTRELHKLEKEHPEFTDPNDPINRVAGKPLDKFKKVTHKIRMLSMNDTFSEEEVADWEKRISKLVTKKFDYFCELKMDGLSTSLIYKDGKLVSGATRGDGSIGEDVTENIKMIQSVPIILKKPFPKYIEIRGETVMPKRMLRLINKQQEKDGKQIFANTRNVAAGSLRQLDPQIVKERNLDFIAWDIAEIEDPNNVYHLTNHSEKHQLLRKLGFQVAPYERKCKNLKEIFAFINEFEKTRSKLDYGTDGIVVAVDDLEIQKGLGVVGKAPRYCVAYKYPAEKATTKVLDISVNVGRTGVLTPLAHFEPTLVAGSTISKATLHNIDQIERLDIRIGDTIVIQKAGDVIPEVVEVLTKMRTGKEKKFKMPTNCPICGFKVERRETGVGKSPMSNGLASSTDDFRRGDPRTLRRGAFSESGSSVAYYCSNKNCPAKNRRGMEHFVNAYEIYEIGPKILDRLKDEGLISDSADLFTLEKSDLSGLERFGEKSADNIVSSVLSHKKVLLWRFIYALGILHVGEQTAQDISNSFGSLEKIMKASVDEINQIENIGPVVARSVYEFFREKANINFISKLLKNGVLPYQQKTKSKKLEGKTFVLTGTLETMSREEAKKKIVENGGKVSGSVSTKTSYVVAGAEPGSKYKDAQKLNVKIISESEFIKML